WNRPSGRRPATRMLPRSFDAGLGGAKLDLDERPLIFRGGPITLKAPRPRLSHLARHRQGTHRSRDRGGSSSAFPTSASSFATPGVLNGMCCTMACHAPD